MGDRGRQCYCSGMSKALVSLAAGSLFFLSLATPAFAVSHVRAHAICRDNTISYSINRQGTCSWHKGVKRWLY